MTDINDKLNDEQMNVSGIGGSQVMRIDSHRWNSGQLQFRVHWSTEQPSWEDFRLLKVDNPLLTAEYIVENNVTTSTRQGVDRTIQWAKKTVQDVKGLCKELEAYMTIVLTRMIMCTTRRAGVHAKKHKKQRPVIRLNFGMVVPRNVAQAYDLDRINGNNFWHKALKAEINSLIALECFEFHDTGHHPGDKYQWTSLTIIFDVKQDLRRKAQLVAG